jgi:purine nucleoside permease
MSHESPMAVLGDTMSSDTYWIEWRSGKLGFAEEWVRYTRHHYVTRMEAEEAIQHGFDRVETRIVCEHTEVQP